MTKKRVAWNKGKKGYKIHSEESKEKIRNAMTGKTLSDEVKNKISNANKGKEPWNKGKTGVYSKETIKQKSDSLKGHIVSEASKGKISNANKGKEPWNKGKTGVYSKETIKKMSKGLKGKEPWNKNKTIFTARKDIIYYCNKYPFFSKIEEMRYNPDKPLEEKEIQVHCKNSECKNSKEKGGWFTPTRSQIAERIRQLEDEKGNGGSYFYCSDGCKYDCILYNLYSDPYKDLIKLYTQEEYNIWKQVVLEQDNYECQKCESKEELNCHHIHPVKTHPHLALDPTNGIILCKKCHYEIGHKSGTECSTGNLANKNQSGCTLGKV